MTVGRICVRDVVTVLEEESVSDAAVLMERMGVGTVVVVDDEDGSPLGMLTDRDVALRCVGRRLDPDVTEVRDVMTSPVESVEESTPLERAVERMASGGTRRLVVTDASGRLEGIVALDDVLDVLIGEAEDVARVLRGQAPDLGGE